MTAVRYLFVFAFCLLAVSGCGSRPDPFPELHAVTPTMAVNDPRGFQGRRVEWGGVLIRTENRRDHTSLEILAYPLDSHGKPDRDRPPLGRFLAKRQGYLEPLEFDAGRLITVEGFITGIHRGRIGEKPHIFPTLHADRIRLWSRDSTRDESRIRFGIGVGIGL